MGGGENIQYSEKK